MLLSSAQSFSTYFLKVKDLTQWFPTCGALAYAIHEGNFIFKGALRSESKFSSFNFYFILFRGSYSLWKVV